MLTFDKENLQVSNFHIAGTNLDNEILYVAYDEDDYNDENEMYEFMRIYFEDSIDSMKRAMEKVKSFNDIEKCKQYYSTT